MTTIVERRLSGIRGQLARLNMGLVVDDDAKSYLVDAGWSESTGAQQLESILRAQFLVPLSSMILENRIRDGWTAQVCYDGKILIYPVEHSPPEPEKPMDNYMINMGGSLGVPSFSISNNDGPIEGSYVRLVGTGLQGREKTHDTSSEPGKPILSLIRQLQPQRLWR